MEKAIAFIVIYFIIGAVWTFLAMLDYYDQHRKMMPIKSRWIIVSVWPLYLFALWRSPKKQP
jgi:hypothetical protein